MKNKFFKSLLLVVCCSVLFSVGNFASAQKTDNNYLTNFISEKQNDTAFEFVLCLGNEFGDLQGYYKLDLAKTFDCKVDSINPESFFIRDEGSELYIYTAREKNGRGYGFNAVNCLNSNKLNSIGINPNTVSVNDDGYLVSKENNKTLYWHRLNVWDGTTLINENPANCIYLDEEPFSIKNMKISLIDSLLDSKTDSGDKCNKVSVIIKLGDNFGERAGYYKLNVKGTFLPLYGCEIEESTCPQYTVLPSEGGGSISTNSSNGGCHCFLDPFELFLYGITPDNSYYISEEGYLVFMDRVHNWPLVFERLEECPEGGVKLYQPASITQTILEENIPNHTIEVVAKLGEEFGDNAGYYILDITN